MAFDPRRGAHHVEHLADRDQDSTEISRWSSISVPTLLLAGADTWEPMPTTMNALARTIPAARHVVWPGQSHFVTMTTPALFAEALQEFFAAAPAVPPGRSDSGGPAGR